MPVLSQTFSVEKCWKIDSSFKRDHCHTYWMCYPLRLSFFIRATTLTSPDLSVDRTCCLNCATDVRVQLLSAQHITVLLRMFRIKSFNIWFITSHNGYLQRNLISSRQNIPTDLIKPQWQVQYADKTYLLSTKHFLIRPFFKWTHHVYCSVVLLKLDKFLRYAKMFINIKAVTLSTLQIRSRFLDYKNRHRSIRSDKWFWNCSYYLSWR
jgi:hypothetical protein